MRGPQPPLGAALSPPATATVAPNFTLSIKGEEGGSLGRLGVVVGFRTWDDDIFMNLNSLSFHLGGKGVDHANFG